MNVKDYLMRIKKKCITPNKNVNIKCRYASCRIRLR